MNDKRVNEVLKKVGIFVIVASLFCFLCVISTPEKALIWAIYREENCSLAEANQAEITLVEEGDNKIYIYQTIINGNEQLWKICPLMSRWLVTKYTPEVQFNEIKAELTRQDMTMACIQEELKEAQCEEIELWQQYALLSDIQVEERYKQYFYVTREN